MGTLRETYTAYASAQAPAAFSEIWQHPNALPRAERTLAPLVQSLQFISD